MFLKNTFLLIFPPIVWTLLCFIINFLFCFYINFIPFCRRCLVGVASLSGGCGLASAAFTNTFQKSQTMMSPVTINVPTPLRSGQFPRDPAPRVVPVLEEEEASLNQRRKRSLSRKASQRLTSS